MTLIDADVRDAKRYRWLRSQANIKGNDSHLDIYIRLPEQPWQGVNAIQSAYELDAAIDAAITTRVAP